MLDGLKYYSTGGSNTLYDILKDHLVSARTITNTSGITISGGEQRYYPFGESRLTATMLTDKLFTGQREMAGLGIYHYQARFYSPKLGRFLSPDIIVPGYGNPQNLNRFGYVLNNPLRYTDPTGHMVDDDLAGGCGLPSCTEPEDPPGGGGGGGGGGQPGLDPIDGEPVEPNLGGSQPLPAPYLNTDYYQSMYLTYLNGGAAQPPPPQSINWCSWIDCGLSLVSILASGVITAFPEVPVAVGIAFVVDIVVTVVAINRTNYDYDQGKISQFKRGFLNWTAGIGALPIPYVGLGLSIINGMSTATGIPN